MRNTRAGRMMRNENRLPLTAPATPIRFQSRILCHLAPRRQFAGQPMAQIV